MCRAYSPAGRVILEQETSHAHLRTTKRNHRRGEPPKAESEWTGVATMLMGVGSDPISVMGGGADIIFETVVGYL